MPDDAGSESSSGVVYRHGDELSSSGYTIFKLSLPSSFNLGVSITVFITLNNCVIDLFCFFLADDTSSFNLNYDFSSDFFGDYLKLLSVFYFYKVNYYFELLIKDVLA